ncbi:hypothetical protein ACH4UM_07065 [Streptomyces sp. NPDC020801]|uniref:hypothetical protein n=1 Tax=unclassified Streptomyces TaxID=2593676 RepID=UPI0037B00781
MNSTLHSRCVRALAAGTLSAALLTAGSAGAFAVTAPKPKPKPGMTHTGMPSTMPSMTMMRSITVRASRTTVKAGQSVTFTGRTAGLKAGTTLVLQLQRNGKWTTLRSTTLVKKGNTYTLTRKLTAKGTQHIRVATSSGTAHSPAVTLKVT